MDRIVFQYSFIYLFYRFFFLLQVGDVLFADIRSQGTGLVRFGSERDAQRAVCKFYSFPSWNMSRFIDLQNIVCIAHCSHAPPIAYGRKDDRSWFLLMPDDVVLFPLHLLTTPPYTLFYYSIWFWCTSLYRLGSINSVESRVLCSKASRNKRIRKLAYFSLARTHWSSSSELSRNWNII